MSLQKQSAKINPVVVVFMRPIEPGSPFPVNISLFAGEQSELSMRIAATVTDSLCALMQTNGVFGRERGDPVVNDAAGSLGGALDVTRISPERKHARL